MHKYWVILLSSLCLTLVQAQETTNINTSTQQQTPSISRSLNSILFDAAKKGDEAILAQFISAHYNLNVHDSKGYTALILAAYHGHNKAVDQLLEAGADPCAQDLRGNTAVMGAIFRGELKIARKLIATHCQPDQLNYAGQTAAMYAALFQRPEILDALVAKGADLKISDIQGNTAENLSVTR